MKKITKTLLLTIIALFAFNVNAIDLKEGVTYVHSRGNKADQSLLKRANSDWMANSPVHYISDDKETVAMFCLDPTQLAPDTKANDDQLKVDRLLYGQTNPRAIAEDYAISVILGSSGYLDKIDNRSDREAYAAVSFALRVFENGVLQNINVESPNYGISSLLNYIKTLKHWVDTDAEFKTKFNDACSLVNGAKCNLDEYINIVIEKYANSLYDYAPKTKAKFIKDIKKNDSSGDDYNAYNTDCCYSDYVTDIYIQNPKSSNGNVNNHSEYKVENGIDNAKQYLSDALDAFTKIMKNNGVVSSPIAIVKEEQIIKGSFESTAIVSVSFNNFGDNYNSSYFNILNIKTSSTSSNAQLLGYNMSFPENKTDYTTTSEKNIYKLAGGNNKIYLVFKITSSIAHETDENCNIDFNLEYKYDDPALYTGAFILAQEAGNATSAYQRFIAFNRGVTSNLNIKLDQCPACEPINTFKNNCENSTETVYEDGATYLVARFKEGYNDAGQEDIGKCVLSNSDAQGNSYQVADFQNPYCTAYCKEDVEVKMPYKLESYAGRTIKLDVKIKGVQSCYTAIDYTAYNNDNTRTDAEKTTLLAACRMLDIDYKFEPTFGYEYEGFKVGTDGRTGTLEQKSFNEKTTRSYYKDASFTTKESELKAAYVKVEKEVNAVYTTPRKYYVNHNNRGLVSAYNYDKTLTTEFLEQNDLVDGLPISVNTLGGTYEYSLSLSDIGTYYANPKDGLGRIVGKENSLAAIGKSDANNKYKCTYGVDNICIEVDNNNKEQYCAKDESPEDCEKRLCPNQGVKANCIKEKGVYYICDSRKYDSTEGVCHRYGSNESDRQRAVEYAEKNGGENVNCCPNCVIKIIPSCPACIITNGGTTLDYRTVSKASLNPNGKTMGYNWNTNNTQYPELTIKAKYTIDEIQSSEENKFNESTTDADALSNSYLLRVEMTQSMAEDIKKYNKATNKDGSYINSTMECKDLVVDKKQEDCTGDYKWDEKKKNCVIERILCYSTFIDDLIEGDDEGLIEGYADRIKFGIDPNKSSIEVRKDLKDNNYAFKKYDYKVPGELGSSTVTVMSNGYWFIFPDFSKNYVGPSWK